MISQRISAVCSGVLLCFFGLSSTLSASTLTWTGGGNLSNFSDLANWSGTPTGGTINELNLTDDYIVNASNFSIARTSRLNFRDGGSLTFDQGSLTLTGGSAGLGVLESPDALGVLNLNSGSITAQFLAEMNVTLGGTGNLTLNGGGNPVNQSTINLLGDAFTLHFNSEPPTNVASEHVGKFLVNGVPAVVGSSLDTFEPGDNLLIVSDGGSGSFVTTVAPPTPLTLRVNTTTGFAAIQNNIGEAISLDFYKLQSESGALQTTGWTSLQDQNEAPFPGGDGSGNGWEEAGGSNAAELGETFLLGTSTLPDSATVSLGTAFNTSGSQDLVFTYHDAVEDLLLTGNVEYFAGPAEADFDSDGDVDGADFLTWQAGFNTNSSGDTNSDGDTDANDFHVWQNQYGLAPATASLNAEAVPEPSSVLLVLGMLSVFAAFRLQK